MPGGLTSYLTDESYNGLLPRNSKAYSLTQFCYPAAMQKLPRSFYNRDTVLVARELLGMHLIRKLNGVERVGRIIEVEAYLGPHDPGRTLRPRDGRNGARSCSARRVTPMFIFIYGRRITA